MSESVLPPELIQAYRETEYHVRGVPPFTLRVDRSSPELLDAYQLNRVNSCAFLTACNPYSRRLTEEENLVRQKALAKTLRARGLIHIEGVGQHPANGWEGEASHLIFNLNREAAKSMGQQFDQNALVWAAEDGVPELILLR